MFLHDLHKGEQISVRHRVGWVFIEVKDEDAVRVWGTRRVTLAGKDARTRLILRPGPDAGACVEVLADAGGDLLRIIVERFNRDPEGRTIRVLFDGPQAFQYQKLRRGGGRSFHTHPFRRAHQ